MKLANAVNKFSTSAGEPELVESTDQQNATSHEGTKQVLANFMEDIEFQRVHRMGKPRIDGRGSRTIIPRFLRLPDRERVFLMWT